MARGLDTGLVIESEFALDGALPDHELHEPRGYFQTIPQSAWTVHDPNTEAMVPTVLVQPKDFQ